MRVDAESPATVRRVRRRTLAVIVTLTTSIASCASSASESPAMRDARKAWAASSGNEQADLCYYFGRGGGLVQTAYQSLGRVAPGLTYTEFVHFMRESC